ncbi:hypothetical protein QFC22_003203 [Naganishia vaughanmartiniae]|uniref:Uncharacterized protein n=1 Tax=Naganishia vaughanmartiniae TaxID=1424756 RepID=A0ACC2X7C0_9TREE|nr:hypothetical protein QFC22_003203 [Naganishia vaughanmartiniae]
MDNVSTAPAASKSASSKPKPISTLCAVHNPQGIIAHWTKPGQIVAWNMVGQVAFGETLNVTILTPYTPPPKEHERIAIKSRPPPPASSVVVHEETEEAPSIPPEFDRIPCWIDRFPVETQRDPEVHLEMSQLLLKLTVLETNLNLTVRGTQRDHILGVWENTCQLSEETFKLSSKIAEQSSGAKRSSTLSDFARATELLFQCIAWSDAPILPAPWGPRPHDSLLAVGTRLGSIALWHLNPQRKWVRIWCEVVKDQWITNVVWSDWKTTDSSTVSNELAFTCDDGSVHTMGVELEFGEDGNHSSVLVQEPITHSPANQYAVTGLRYVHRELVCTRTGQVQVFSKDRPHVEEIRLPRIGSWPSCSPYSPCNGIGALPGGRILVSLYSGEQHVIRFERGKTVLDHEASARFSEGMRRSVEQADVHDEESLSRKSPRITGFTLAPSTVGDRGSTLFACMLEPANLQDFEFPKDNNRKHILVLGNLAADYFPPPEEQSTDDETDPGGSASEQYAALQTASAILLPFLPNTVPPDTLQRLVHTSLHIGNPVTPNDQPRAITREVLLEHLKYSWMDSEKAKLFQLKNVWRMWNESQPNYEPASNPFASATHCGPMEVLLEPLFVYLAGVCILPGAGKLQS